MNKKTFIAIILFAIPCFASPNTFRVASGRNTPGFSATCTRVPESGGFGSDVMECPAGASVTVLRLWRPESAVKSS